MVVMVTIAAALLAIANGVHAEPLGLYMLLAASFVGASAPALGIGWASWRVTRETEKRG